MRHFHKEFLGTEDGLKLLPNISNVVRDPRVSGVNGQVWSEKLFTTSQEAISEKSKKATTSEIATTEMLYRMAQVKGMTEQLK